MASNHFMADLYPNMGFLSTNQLSVPEADDQHALVDDQKLAAEKPHNVDPSQHKKIFISVAVVVAIIIALNLKW